MGELDGVDDTLRADNVGNMRDGRSGSGSEVENLGSGFDLTLSAAASVARPAFVQRLSITHVDVIETTENTGRELTPEGVPDSVLDLLLLSELVGAGDRNSLLSVDRLSGSHVPRDEQVLLALGDVDTGVLVRLESDGTRTLSSSESRLAASSTSTSRSTSSSGSASA